MIPPHGVPLLTVMKYPEDGKPQQSHVNSKSESAMGSVIVDWCLQRQEYDTVYHLNFLLGSKEKLVVGRVPGSSVDIVCNGKTVSRKHCELIYNVDHWEVKDLGSMNGIYLNKKKIASHSSTPLKVGDVLGIGAIDTSDPDYFLFNVTRNIIKDENEKASKSASTPPVITKSVQQAPVPSISTNKNGADVAVKPKITETNSNSSDVASTKLISEKSIPSVVRNPSPIPSKIKNISPVPSLVKSSSPVPSLDDIKLLPKACFVKLERIKTPEPVEQPTEPVEQPTEPVVKRRRRRVIRPIDSDSDDDTSAHRADAPFKTLNLKEQNVASAAYSKRLDKIAVDSGSESSDADSQRKKSRKTKGHFVIEKFSNSSNGRLVQRKDVSLGPGSNNNSYSQMLDVEEATNDSESAKPPSPDLATPTPAKTDKLWDDDDDVIVLDSDEETFCSQPRIKKEPIEEVILDSPDLEEVNGDVQPIRTEVSSSEDDEPFFPELSQNFCAEIEAEEEDERRSTEAKSIENGERNVGLEKAPADKLENILDRFKAQGPKKLPFLVDPAPLKKNKQLRPEPQPKRTVKVIPPKPKKTQSSSKKVISTRAKLQKEQDLQGYTVSVKQATGKKTVSSTAGPSTQNQGEATLKKAVVPNEKFVKIPKKSTKSLEKTASTVKAKVTKKSRADMLSEDIAVSKESKKRSNSGGLPGFTIPKKPRVDEPSDAAVSEEVNLDLPLEMLDDLPYPLTTPQFKKPVQRISRLQSNETTDPLPVTPLNSSTAKRKENSYKPREDALPLGFKKQSTPFINVPVTPKPVNRPTTLPLSDPLDVTENSPESLPGPSPLTPVPKTSRLDQDDRPFRNASPEKKSKSCSFRKGSIEDDDAPYRNASPITECQLSSGEKNLSEVDRTLPLLVPETQERTGTLAGIPLGAVLKVPFRPGILSNGVPRNGGPSSKTPGTVVRRVNFAEENQIREIEARENPSQPKAQSYLSGPRAMDKVANKVHHPAFRPVHPPIDIDALVDDMLLRIVCWNFNWIAEQQNVKDEPPPLLQEMSVQGKNGEIARTLPQLNALPVVSSFSNMEAYLGVFHPLMLHELWGNICKEAETIESRTFQVVIGNVVNSNGAWVSLRCSSLLEEGTPRFLRDQDLMMLSVPLNGKTKRDSKVFGIVEAFELRKLKKTEELPIHLRATCRRPDLLLSFNLRLKRAQRYDFLDFSKVFTVAKVTSLNMVVKQFRVNAELSLSPLYNVILKPAQFEEAFQLMQSNSPEIIHRHLNPAQLEAVRSISETMLKTYPSEPKVALLQGPPGTGKSHVIVQLVIRMLFKRFGKTGTFPRILICAPSNHAVDEIAFRLMKCCEVQKEKFSLVRVGVPASMHAKVKSIHLDTLADINHVQKVAKRDSPFSLELRTLEEEGRTLQTMKHALTNSIKISNSRGDTDGARVQGRKLEDLECQIERLNKSLNESKERHTRHFDAFRFASKEDVLSRAHVICSTLNSCRNKDMERAFMKGSQDRRTFLCCIIDEASQCTEPESLTPLALGISKLVLIGDPEQLPATVTSQFAQKLRFDQSLFNRFFSYRTSVDPDKQTAVQMLDTQYRMAESICQWPSKFFYGRKLLTADINRLGPCKDYLVLNLADGQEMLDPKDGKSVCNIREAELVAAVVKILVQSQLTRFKSIGVITYYQKQKQCILEEIKANKCLNENGRVVEVNTVDAYQGQEKDIVILSSVRAKTNTGGDIGFVNSLQRMNVALTRAKESLIVCAHFPTLSVSEAWKDLIEDANNRKVAHTITSENVASSLQRLLFEQPLAP